MRSLDDRLPLSKLLRWLAYAVLLFAVLCLVYGLYLTRDRLLVAALIDLLYIPVGATLISAACYSIALWLERRSSKRGGSVDLRRTRKRE